MIDRNTKFTILITILLMILFFIGLRSVHIDTRVDMTYGEICQAEHEQNWTYQYSDVFGRTCVKIDYLTFEKIERVPFTNMTSEEIREKYCHVPKFFDLSDWGACCWKSCERGKK